ncbi:hypothetical protein C8034_v000012 [Colletotrichum sidae]|uniref:Uncharacterized protein n=1 Tax=Colletotrichum sidae TaxID=1347389 RepID=A0A4R8SMB5_9PEZI|nr:hypothetical protein C8034_v000012 [Colletotrichum sidae]
MTSVCELVAADEPEVWSLLVKTVDEMLPLDAAPEVLDELLAGVTLDCAETEMAGVWLTIEVGVEFATSTEVLLDPVGIVVLKPRELSDDGAAIDVKLENMEDMRVELLNERKEDGLVKAELSARELGTTDIDDGMALVDGEGAAF